MRTTILAAALIAAAGFGAAVTVVPVLAQGTAQPAPAARPAPAAELGVAQVVQRLEAAGYTAIAEVEREHDHYEVKATDRDGRRVELELDLVTGEVLKTEVKRSRRSSERAAQAPR
jgi:hypothetical protein